MGVLSLLLLLTGNQAVQGQLQFPGRALGINSGLKAAEVMYVLPPVDPLEIEAEKELNRTSHSKPLRFALERPVNLTPETHGSWSREAGLRVWRIHILSPGAYSLGMVFASYELLPGVKLFVYDPAQQQVKGAFTSGNNKPSRILPVGHIPGDEVVIELQVPEAMLDYGELVLESLSHAFLKTGHNPSSAAECPAGVFGCSQACEIDVNCVEGDYWWLVKPSVVRIYTTTLYCTGVLVNNSSYDGTPYILTAEHCISRQEHADRSVFLFNYESAACFGEDGPLNMSLEGATLHTCGDSLDFSLVELVHTPPASYNVYYAGWDRSQFQTSSTVTIHHPFGDVKKISIDEDIPSIPQLPDDVPSSLTNYYHYFSYWWIKWWDVGSTEGGSSGSPLFNQDRRVIGMLSGGEAACGDSIDYDYENDRVIYNPAPNHDDYYTQFGLAWDYEEAKGNALKPYLDPVNTGYVTLNGYNPTSTEPLRVESGQHFQVFPNPAGELFHITPKNPVHQKGSYSIFNVSGALLLQGELDGEGRATIFTRVLAPGLYLITIEAGYNREQHKLMLTGR